MVEEICPLPCSGQNRPLPLLLPPNVQIEDDLISGAPCPKWKKLQKLFCDEDCHTQASCVH